MNSNDQAVPSPPAPRPSRRRRVLLFVIPTVLVLIGALGAYRLHVHVQTESSFCLGSCHNETATQNRMALGGHSALACPTCHELTFSQGARLFFQGKIQGPNTNPPHAKVRNRLCAPCHTDPGSKTLPVGDTIGHRVHSLEQQKLECVKCHYAANHDLSPKAESCVECHPNKPIREKGMEKIACLSCHNFLARTYEGARPAATDCQRCHGGHRDPSRSDRFAATIPATNVSTAMIHGNLFACQLCHDPHAEDPAKRRSGRDCGRCHGGTALAQENIPIPAHRTCATCHAVHSPREDLTRSCAGCHELARPQPSAETTAAKHPACSSCHKAHEFVANPSGCGTCHSDQKKMVTSWSSDVHAVCSNCHAPHRAAAESEACGSCHKNARSGGHRKCMTCHDPHKGKTATPACTSCHGRQAQGLQGAHRGACRGCHSPHATGGASARCKGCHAEQSGLAAAAGNTAHGRCSSCHRPHSFSAAGGGATCKGCHKVSTQGAHKGACRDCHKPHGSPAMGAACAKCHPDIPKGSGKHAQCRSCHAPHQPASQGASQCTTCHARQTAAAAAWGAPQHKACPGCHQVHNPAKKTGCGQCHGKQVSSAAGGKHSCSSCHSPHSAPGSWWARCSQCHGRQASAAKRSGGTHAQCQACHKPHKFRKTTCKACHNAMGRLGSHGRSGHRNCTSCHPSHGKGLPSRKTCLGCHKNMTDHNPKARVCTGCHLFK